MTCLLNSGLGPDIAQMQGAYCEYNGGGLSKRELFFLRSEASLSGSMMHFGWGALRM